jgi:biotin carboxyl carrier protein
MTMNFRITVDGRPYTVSVDHLEETDAPVAETAVLVAAHAASVLTAPPPKPAAAIQTPASAAAGPGTIVSPIGGMVRSIEVEVGSEVTIGETVVIIEVMKMKTEVKSTIAGKVQSISARLNQSVETGEAIMTLAA